MRSDEKVRSSAPAPFTYDTTSAYCITSGSSMPFSTPCSRMLRYAVPMEILRSGFFSSLVDGCPLQPM
ncbi:hypothetical protein D3C72_2040630 [compost metagenome]